MAAAHSHAHAEIKNPGNLKVSGGAKALFLVLIAVGLGCFGYLLATAPARAWSTFLVNHFFFMSLGLSGVFFAAIHAVTGSMWSAPVRRVAESFTGYLPIAALTLIAVFVGTATGQIYEWTHGDVVAADQMLTAKSGYLNVPFFIVRNALVFGALFLFARKFVANSLKQDQTKSFAESARNAALAPGFLIVFALGFTMMSFDQIMSLDPHWFSTIFGVYCFSGLYYSFWALMALSTHGLEKRGLLKGVVNENHFHDIGKFMFAFTVFWAYIGFSQFMLIWYANLPEETRFYLARFDTKWLGLSIFLVVKFALPFFLLLPRAAKRNARHLRRVAVFMLVAQWIDILWLVQPNFFPEGPNLDLFDLGVALGFVGAFAWAVTRFLSKNPVLAYGDPRLAESVHHHHQ
ncbi:MAG: molybdopterin oxidoreductase [Bdellovibrionales bacterium]|nr:molybdopterin oxidoreductase [Bdellovibrionales bacterium]